MYKIQRKRAQSERSGWGGGKNVLRFHGNCLNAIKVHKKEHVTATFSDSNAPEGERPGADRTADRHRWTKSCLTWAQWWGTWGSQQRNASVLLCKVPSARQRGMRQKMKIARDGNCRNGYHKVKCQVPDTEELHRRERGGENKHTRAAARLRKTHNRNVRKLSFSWFANLMWEKEILQPLTR